ncbi:TldD/PmbA family protein [Cytobacillus gottheilii]|uniref:TldD/PmbA family protein n=1 Tax=Cytobacillus gottheilii TaxID=859144 RepID=UPI0009B9476D|nr:TldD/PmbA family protein [Cytobacillus gottheilii]
MRIEDFQEKVFQLGKQLGFEHMEIYSEKVESLGCKLYKGEIDSYQTSETLGVSFRGKMDGNMGYAYTENTDEVSVQYLVHEAKANSLLTEEDVQEEIFKGSVKYEDYSFYSEELNDVSIEEKIEFLKEIEKEVYAFDERVTGTNTLSLSSAEKEKRLVNSNGLELKDRMNHIGLSLSVIVKQGKEVKNGVFSCVTRNYQSLAAKEVAEHAVKEALSKLNAETAESKNYSVILRNKAAAALLQTFSPIFSAENIQKGQSLLKGKLGEKIAAEHVHIVDDPFYEDGVRSSNFDSEGYATRKKDVIKDGDLLTFLHNSLTAKKDKVESTGNAYKASFKGTITVAPSNFYIMPAEKALPDLVAQVDEGILVTSFSGLHSGTNTVSGDFSIAAGGFLIENGEIKTALKQMTVAGNFFDLLQQIEQIGSDLDFSLAFGSPSLLIKELSVTVE